MRVYVTGADGMLGTALTKAFRDDPTARDWPILGVSLSDFDIADAGAVRDSITGFAPDVVVHCAAHAIVDDCEADPRAALRVNVAGACNVAQACRLAGSRLVYISSDYVFDGADTPVDGYRETDVPNPVSVYGLTKLAGERIAEVVADHLIVRTSWLFGGWNERVDNVLAVVRQAARGQRPRLIADQYAAPTYTEDVARAIVFLITQDPPVTGTVHVANANTASWHEVGDLALSLLESDRRSTLSPVPISLDDCAFLGARPSNSTLNTARLSGLGFTMPPWQDGVRRFCSVLAATRRRPVRALTAIAEPLGRAS